MRTNIENLIADWVTSRDRAKTLQSQLKSTISVNQRAEDEISRSPGYPREGMSPVFVELPSSEPDTPGRTFVIGVGDTVIVEVKHER